VNNKKKGEREREKRGKIIIALPTTTVKRMNDYKKELIYM
jgi:hypothetical protein